MFPDEFGLNDMPFGDPTDPEANFESKTFVQASAALLDGIRQQIGLMILTGEPGTGKSLLLRRLGAALGSTVNVVHVENTDFEGDDFVGVVCDCLQIATREQTPWDRVRDLRNVLAVRQRYGTSTALLVDNAQHLPDHVLESLIPLFQAENGRDLLVQIVLAGTEELSVRVHQPEFAGIRHRVALELRLENLTDGEVEEYVHARLRAAGHTGGSLFTRNAIQCVAENSYAIPRRIDAICGAALAAARDKGDAVVTCDTVREVPADLESFASSASEEGDHPGARERLVHGASAATTSEPAASPERSGTAAIRPSTYELELVARRQPAWASGSDTKAPETMTGAPPTFQRGRRRDRGYRQVRRRVRAYWRRLQSIATAWHSRLAAVVRRGAKTTIALSELGWQRLRARLVADPPTLDDGNAMSTDSARYASDLARPGRLVFRTAHRGRVAVVGALVCAFVVLGALFLVSERVSGPSPIRAKVPAARVSDPPPATEQRMRLASVPGEIAEAMARAEAQRRALAERIAMLETGQAALRAELAKTIASVSARNDYAAQRLDQLDSLAPPRGRLGDHVTSAGVAWENRGAELETTLKAPAVPRSSDREPDRERQRAELAASESPAPATRKPNDRARESEADQVSGGASGALVDAPRSGKATKDAAAVTKAFASAPGGARWTRYTVARGDTLWSIARDHDVAIEDLRRWNELIGDVVRPGQRMAIRAAAKPPAKSPTGSVSRTAAGADARWYTVRAGDTLWRISEQLEVSVDDLRRHNDVGANDRILVGQRLQIGPADRPGDLNQALVEAAEAGRAAAARRLLAQGANPNTRSEDGKTALIIATSSGHAEMVEALLAGGADPDLGDRAGETPLMTGAARGDTDIVEVLLRRGANPNARGPEGWTALIHAAVHGHADTVRTLARGGANPNARVEGGRSALAAAVWNGHVAVVKVLLESGAEINAKSDDGWTPLMDGALTGQLDVVRVLMDNGANPEEIANDGQTALTVAQERGHVAVAYVLASYHD